MFHLILLSIKFSSNQKDIVELQNYHLPQVLWMGGVLVAIFSAPSKVNHLAKLSL